MHDHEAWKKYPNYHIWFNKLWLAEQLKYDCGPCGVPPARSGEYVVRPIYNLSGMGVGSSIKFIDEGDTSKVPPGYFWCEKFEGNQYSVTYKFHHAVNPYWEPIVSYCGVKSNKNLSKFSHWCKSDYAPKVPRLFNELSEVQIINIEFIDDNPIEVHLRESPDPEYDILIPIWRDEDYMVDKYEKLGYTYIKSFENADGFLSTPRLGFMVKENDNG